MPKHTLGTLADSTNDMQHNERLQATNLLCGKNVQINEPTQTQRANPLVSWDANEIPMFEYGFELHISITTVTKPNTILC